MNRFDYNVVCIEPSERPDRADDGTWHRYIIANHVSSITGYRTGTRKEVAEHARECARRLNSKLR